MYEEELPLTGTVVALGGVAFDTWWIAVFGVMLVLVGTVLARVGRRVRPQSRR
jgi:type IV secretory pathway TrbD component